MIHASRNPEISILAARLDDHHAIMLLEQSGFPADEQWSEEANVPGQHWVGFRFIDIAPADAAVLRDWLNGSERLD